MPKGEKLLQKAEQNPKNVRFNELDTLLQQFGFEKIKTNAGSHFKWRNKEKLITYMCPRKNPVKSVYIKQLIKILKTHFNI
jgi:hypothetical protein